MRQYKVIVRQFVDTERLLRHEGHLEWHGDLVRVLDDERQRPLWREQLGGGPRSGCPRRVE